MTGRYLSLPIPRPPADLFNETPGERPEHRIAWIDGEGREITAPQPVDMPPVIFAETFGGEGGPRWDVSQADLSLETPPPESAVSIRLEGPGWDGQTMALEAVSRRIPAQPDVPLIIRGSKDAPWRLAVVADGYRSAPEFERDVDRLWVLMSQAVPFNTLIGEGLVGMVGLFWASDDGSSLFDARPRDHNPWIIYGNESAVNAAAAQTGERYDKILVVMNRPERGGAGGFDAARPSWTTNVDSPPEEWPQIALHELGHAFGLADEYETEGNGTLEPDPLEPNVSKIGDPRHVAWAARVTADRQVVPTLKHGEQASPLTEGKIGTFEGARYHAAGFYRPSYGCRMRWTTWEFCDVCAAVITGTIRGIS